MKYLSLFIVILMVMCAGGCNILGFLADKTTTGATADAHYVLPNEPTVVIAENWRNPSGTALDAEQVSEQVFENLRAHNVAPMLDPSVVSDLHSQRSDFRNLSVAQIGKIVGAHQVVYVNMTDTSLLEAQGSESMHGKATARVKVIDVQSGASVWPLDSAEGFPVSISTPMRVAHDDAAELAERQHLLDALADRVSRLFYEAPAEE